MQNTLFLIAAIVVIAAIGIGLMFYLGPKQDDVEKLLGPMDNNGTDDESDEAPTKDK